MKQSEHDGFKQTVKAQSPCPWCKSKEGIIRDGIYTCPRCHYECDVSGPFEIQVIGWTNSRDTDYPETDCRTAAIYDALVKEVREKGYRFTWDDHQSEALACTPVINNGFKISCGPKTWGSVMAEAHGDSESDVLYTMGFIDNPVYPEKGVDYARIIQFEI